MSKRMKLPNGFGTIKCLGGRRRNPYAVYPPVERYTEKGPVTPKALAYKPTWEEAYEVLTTYNLEKQGKIKVGSGVFIDRTPTFAEVYERFFEEKYVNSPRKLSKASMGSTRAAFKNCSELHDERIGNLKYDDLQRVINDCSLKHSSIELMISLMHQMYKYALKYEIVDKDYSRFLIMPKPDDDESGVPFTNEDLKKLWENKYDTTISMILIMCYSGYRIKAFTDMTINLEEKYFKGGVKTVSSKGRIVPIHSAIYSLVAEKYDGSKNILNTSFSTFRLDMYKKLEEIGIVKHTPHDCRHTFSVLCEKYKVNENDRKRLLGHSFGNDITNAKYSHRTLEELREEIEKIKIPI